MLPFLITACSSTTPTQVEFQQQSYQLVHSQNLDNMAHLFMLHSKLTPL